METTTTTSRQLAGIVRRLGANISSSEILDEEDIVIVDTNEAESAPPAAPAIHHCNHCDKAFGEWENLVEHCSRRHPGRPRPVRSQSQQGPPRPRLSLQTLQNTAQTNRASKGRPGRRCRNYNVQSNQLLLTLCRKRTEEKGEGFPCGECGKRFSSSASVRTHFFSLHEPAQFPCRVCGQLFTSKNNEASHWSRHCNPNRRKRFS